MVVIVVPQLWETPIEFFLTEMNKAINVDVGQLHTKV